MSLWCHARLVWVSYDIVQSHHKLHHTAGLTPQNALKILKIVQKLCKITQKLCDITYCWSWCPWIMQASFYIPQCHISIAQCCSVFWWCLKDSRVKSFVMVHRRWIFNNFKIVFLSCRDQILWENHVMLVQKHRKVLIALSLRHIQGLCEFAQSGQNAQVLWCISKGFYKDW